MSIKLITKLDDWLIKNINNCYSDLTHAYVINVLTTYTNIQNDLSKQSIVLTFGAAKETHDFVQFQKLGDWILWLDSIHPTATNETIISIGRSSYYMCYKFVKSWKVYEELADNLPTITNSIRTSIYDHNITTRTTHCI